MLSPQSALDFATYIAFGCFGGHGHMGNAQNSNRDGTDGEVKKNEKHDRGGGYRFIERSNAAESVARSRSVPVSPRRAVGCNLSVKFSIFEHKTASVSVSLHVTRTSAGSG